MEDILLTEKEQERMPEPLQQIRDGWIDAIRNLETEQPHEDGGASTNALLNLLAGRMIFDYVEREMFLKDK